MAEKSFRFYRNVNEDDPLPSNVSKDWEELCKHVDESLKTEHSRLEYKDLCKYFTVSITIFVIFHCRFATFTFNTNMFSIYYIFVCAYTVGTRAGRKAFIIGVALILMHELCGCFTMLNYTALIFRQSGSAISPNLSAIIVGAIQLLGTYVATFLVDRIGRKILLTFSAIGTAICLACLGAYSYCNSIGISVEEYSWISIASFSGMMFLAACGIVPLMFVVIAEVMPEKVGPMRRYAFSLSYYRELLVEMRKKSKNTRKIGKFQWKMIKTTKNP